MTQLPYHSVKLRKPINSRLNRRPKRKSVRNFSIKKFLVLLLFVVFLGVSGGSILIGAKGFLPIRQVECRASDDTPESELNSWCSFLQDQLIGKSLIFFSDLSVAASLRKMFPAVGVVNLKKNWPSGVTGELQKRKPLLAVYSAPEASTSSQPDGFYWVDEAGVVFSNVEDTTRVPSLFLPEASGQTRLKIGSILDSAFAHFTVDVVSKLNAAGLISVYLRESADNSLFVSLSNGTTIQLTSRKAIAEQVTVLQLIMEKYRIEGKALKRVDLRFQDPVVEY